MTWAEFKEYVDKQLEEQGIDESVEINYIDISTIYDELTVFVDQDGLAVS